MTMTRRDFEAVALILRTTKSRGDEFATPEAVVAYIAGRLAQMYAGDNPRFDSARFLQAALGVSTADISKAMPPRG